MVKMVGRFIQVNTRGFVVFNSSKRIRQFLKWLLWLKLRRNDTSILVAPIGRAADIKNGLSKLLYYYMVTERQTITPV